MNNILKESLVDDTVSALSLESHSLKIDSDIEQLDAAVASYQDLNVVRTRLIKRGGISRSFVMESYELAPNVLNKPLNDYTVAVSQENYAVSLEAVEEARKSMMDRIKSIIKKIVDFAIAMFNRLKEYILKFASAGEQNKRSLHETQLLLNSAKQGKPKETVATEGYATGTIPLQAPHFLHIEYSKIIAETEKLETLAGSYIKDMTVLLTLQFKHCKFIIEAYNKLMNDPTTTLEEFDTTCRRVVSEGERRAQEFTSMKVFDCIEILEEIRDNEYAGVLKYRASIKPPSKEDMVYETVNVTTNLMKAQDLQDRLTSLNDEIVRYANEIKTFFVGNSKTFLDTLNRLNSSAVTSPTGTFNAHSDYITQVHTFLVRGNLIQVVMGLNVLNTVWKSVHNLNSRVVKEFLSS